MKYKKSVIIILILISIISIITINKSYAYKSLNTVEEKKFIKEGFAIYKEQNMGKGDHTLTTDTTFPTQGYFLNTTKSKCIDYEGNTVSNSITLNDDMSITVVSSKSLYCNFYYDKDNVAPKVKSISLSGTDKSNETLSNGYTYGRTVSYTITWDDSDVVYFCVKEGSNACTTSEWVKLTDTNKSKSGTITITTGDGSKTINAYLKDRANNVSLVVANTSNKAIILDTTSPTITSFSMTGSAGSGLTLSDGSKYTHTNTVTYNMKWSATDVGSYCISNSSSGCTGTINSGWLDAPGTPPSSTALTRTTPTIENTDGSKKMYLHIKDKANNTASSNASIILDKTNPTATIKFASATETSITVTVSGTDTNGIDTNKMYCRKSGVSSWTKANSNGTCTVTGLSGGNTYTIQAYVYDKTGRTSSVINGTNYKTTVSTLSPSDLLTKKPKGLSTEILGDMYRFVGTKDDVNNYICFGNGAKCNETDDYMYRIIGITETGEMKLIKNTAIREGSVTSFQWDIGGKTSNACNNGKCEWPESLLFKRLNGTSGGSSTGASGNTNIFVNGSAYSYMATTSDWYKKISDHSWWYGDIYLPNIDDHFGTAEIMYRGETGEEDVPHSYTSDGVKLFWSKWPVSQKISAKIGLMYLHDYYFAYSLNYNSGIYADCRIDSDCLDGWLPPEANGGECLNSEGDWTITRNHSFRKDGKQEYSVHLVGCYTSNSTSVSNARDVRPVFYLSNAVKLKGSGTISDPFIVQA